ncbi:MAG: OmpH family outer membrane protein, partial [Acaryochloridaceae cyanobacterium RU_4_10]|nr:OmpH family outer membrane protein [Acaryochloridaceae cyanobacterium RU_4_10]
FGVEGDLFKKRQELIQPIQEKIFVAIREYANENGYEAMFDKSGEAGVLYANPKYDKSDNLSWSERCKSQLGRCCMRHP